MAGGDLSRPEAIRQLVDYALKHITPGLASAIDLWSAKQPDHPSRPVAIIRLAEIGLKAES